MLVKQPEICMEKKPNLYVHFMAYTKNSLKWILDQNVKVKIIKLLEKNLGEKKIFFF